MTLTWSPVESMTYISLPIVAFPRMRPCSVVLFRELHVDKRGRNEVSQQTGHIQSGEK
jgi:hypothetical protein